ncbi:MAG TPA: dihydroneopterin aldolase [Polyangiaceae bacterium]|nr:dihydroneopterin aldolase [Polyangiaceae bacterium]
MTGEPPDWIFLSKVALSFPCVLGVLDWERRQAQTLELELAMNLDLDQAAAGDLGRSVDYSAILDQVQFIAQHGRWLLLESMAAAMARLVLAPPAPGEPRAQVRGVLVRLRKPEVLRGRAIPAIEIRRDDAWYRTEELAIPQLSPARIEVLQETRQTGAYRIHLPPGARWVVPSNLAVQIVAGRVALLEGPDGTTSSSAADDPRSTRATDGTAPQADGMLRPRAVLVGGDRVLSIAEDAPACLLGVCQPPLSKGPGKEPERRPRR